MTAFNLKIDEALESLKEFADFLAANHDRLTDVKFDLDFMIYNASEKELAALLRCPRPFDNRWEKDGTDSNFYLRTQFGEVGFAAMANRDQVCQAVPTGRKIVRRRLVSTSPVYEDVEIDEVEWVCEPVLTAGRNGHVDATTEVAPF